MKKENKKIPTFEEIHSFIEENYDAPEHLKPGLQELIKSNKSFVFQRIGNEGELVGVSFYKEITPNLVETSTTVVHKKWRRAGVATLLNDKMEKIFEEKKFKKISCFIYTKNLPSIFLKLKRGYLIEGLRRNHDFQGVHEYVLGKEL
jgi:RimJ/RimL family protein N-acetyltransferase